MESLEVWRKNSGIRKEQYFPFPTSYFLFLISYFLQHLYRPILIKAVLCHFGKSLYAWVAIPGVCVLRTETVLMPAAEASHLELTHEEGEDRQSKGKEEPGYQKLGKKKEQYYPCRERQSAEYNAHDRVNLGSSQV